MRDIGGHTGQYAVLLGSIVGPSGKVVTFEPDSAARAVLERNVAINGFDDRIIIEPFALRDTEGEVTLWSLGGDSMSSFARSGLSSNANKSAVAPLMVKTQVLDHYLARHSMPAPNAVKLDVEGAEIHVLRGPKRVLESDAFIMCELHPYAWPELGVGESDLASTLAAASRRFEPLERGTTDESLQYGSGILVRE